MPLPTYGLTEDRVRSSASNHTSQQTSDEEDLGSYEEDMMEQRIEGIEALVEQLSKTVLELNNKVPTIFQINVFFSSYKLLSDSFRRSKLAVMRNTSISFQC